MIPLPARNKQTVKEHDKMGAINVSQRKRSISKELSQ